MENIKSQSQKKQKILVRNLTWTEKRCAGVTAAGMTQTSFMSDEIKQFYKPTHKHDSQTQRMRWWAH